MAEQEARNLGEDFYYRTETLLGLARKHGLYALALRPVSAYHFRR